MHTKTAIELKESFLNGEHSAVEISKTFLDRIEKLDGQVGAFTAVLNDRALKRAEELDARRAQKKPLGKLAGIPIAIKDNIHIKGELTTCASRFLTNFKAPFEATVTRLLEAEDAIIIGKTNLDEFAMGSSTENSALKKTFNPWDLSRVPGGSSGGSAAAVAARLCPIALGSDTGGSIRQPASFCGITGYKPTYGRVSRFGLVAFGSSLDQIGPLAYNTSDAALAMEVIGQHCTMDSTSLLDPAEEYLSNFDGNAKGFKIGVPWQFLEGLKEEPRRAFESSVEVWKSLGAEIVEVDLSLLKYSIAVYYILATAEASTNLARFDGIRYGARSSKAKTLDEVYDFSKEEGFGDEVKRRIMLGTYVLSAGYQDAYYKKAQKVRTLMIERFSAIFQQCDAIAFPTTPDVAFAFGSRKDPLEMYLEDIYTISTNLAGLPAISIQNGCNSEGLPFGLQLLGPQKGDVSLLRLANAFEQAADHHKNMPELARN